ncbi:MAG: glycerophosphodiester phosphodiesterase family protein [Lentisphaeria bacterium]
MKKTWIIAHRGLSASYPENTFPAFEKAMELDIDGMEFDLHPTRDGKIVVTHDNDLDRCSNGHGPVRDKTLAELKQLDFGSWKAPQFAGTRIPEFHELLDLVERCRPELFLCVELKEDDPVCAQAVLEELQRRNRLHNCSIISSHPAMLRYAYNFDPTLELHGFGAEAMPFDEREDYYRILKRIGYYCKELTPEIVREFHRRGIKVDTWAPDDLPMLEHVLSCDVDIITTNAADVIVKIMEEKKTK